MATMTDSRRAARVSVTSLKKKVCDFMITRAASTKTRPLDIETSLSASINLMLSLRGAQRQNHTQQKAKDPQKASLLVYMTFKNLLGDAVSGRKASYSRNGLSRNSAKTGAIV